MTLTAAAIVPEADATKVYSPSARQPVDTLVPQSAAPATPPTKRGSKAHAPPEGVDGPATSVLVVPPSGVNSSVGLTAVAPRFCTTIVAIVPNRPALFAFFAA